MTWLRIHDTWHDLQTCHVIICCEHSKEYYVAATHTHTHARSHTHTHTHSKTLCNSFSITHALPPTYAHIQTLSLTLSLSHTHSLTRTHSYAHSKGLFFGASLEASGIAARPDVNRKFYGQKLSPSVLLSGWVSTLDFVSLDLKLDFILIFKLLS